jgi:hypothetical protein
MKVFISHSTEDRHLAQKLTAALKGAGLEVFDMYSDIYPGDNWAARVSTALEDSDAMVVLLTPNSVHSPTLDYELGYALGKEEFKNRVFPVVVGDPWELSSEEIPWVLKRFQMFQLRDKDPDVQSLREITQALARAA